MQVASSAAPQPRKLMIASGHQVIRGSIDDYDAEARSLKHLAVLEAILNAQLKEQPVRFTVGDFPVTIDAWEIKLEDIENGSIVVRFSIVGVFTLQLYGAIADYPSFKEAVPELLSDIKLLVAWVANQEDNVPIWVKQGRGEDPHEPIPVELFFKEEEELISHIQNSN